MIGINDSSVKITACINDRVDTGSKLPARVVDTIVANLLFSCLLSMHVMLTRLSGWRNFKIPVFLLTSVREYLGIVPTSLYRDSPLKFYGLKVVALPTIRSEVICSGNFLRIYIIGLHAKVAPLILL